MKILDRYVFRQVLVTSLFAVAVLSVVLVVGKLFKELLDSRPMPAVERANDYYRALIKVPTWYGPNRQVYASAYADGIAKVATAVQRGELA